MHSVQHTYSSPGKCCELKARLGPVPASPGARNLALGQYGRKERQEQGGVELALHVPPPQASPVGPKDFIKEEWAGNY